MAVSRWIGVVCVALAVCGCGASTQSAVFVDGVPPPQPAPEDAEHYSLTGTSADVQVQINGLVTLKLDFPDVKGELVLAANDPERSLANLVINTKAATSNNEELGNIAKSKDFLDVETYPEATFEVRSLTKQTEANAYEMVGVLELHGTAKAITVPLTMQWDECQAMVQTAFSVNRRQFGVESDTMVDGMAGDDVDIRVKMMVKRENAPLTCGSLTLQ